MNKIELYKLGIELFETSRNEESISKYNKLNHFEKIYCDRIYNNMIRQEYY